MKKAVSILLAAALILSLGIPAFAADVTENQGSASSPVTGTYVPGTAGGTVFSVEIQWSGLSFTYNGESKQEWDPEKLEYTGVATPEGWAESNAAITVKNRSNTIITATPNYAKEEGYTAGMNFSTDKLYVLSAEPTGDATTGEVKSGTISVKPTGTLPENTENKTIGTITVTIGEFEDVTIDDAENLQDYLSNEKYTSPEMQNNTGHTHLIVLCKNQDDVDAVDPGREYILAPIDEDYDVEMYDGGSKLSKYEWAVGCAMDYAINDFNQGKITQDVLTQVYIDCVVFDQNLEILVKE